MKNKKGLILLFIVTIISVIILILSIMRLFKNDNNHETLHIDVNKEEKIQNVIDFAINPGDEIIYDIVTNTKEYFNGKVEIWFSDVDTGLKNNLNVYAKYNTYKTQEKDVTELTFISKLTFNIHLDKNNNYFELIFSMPEDVGNELQNKDYNFNTHIKIIEDKKL